MKEPLLKMKVVIFVDARSCLSRAQLTWRDSALVSIGYGPGAELRHSISTALANLCKTRRTLYSLRVWSLLAESLVDDYICLVDA